MDSMIIDFFLLVIYYILKVALLPLLLLGDVTASSGIGSSISTATHYVANWSHVLPLSTIFAVFGIMLAIELGVAVYKIIMWILRRLPTQS